MFRLVQLEARDGFGAQSAQHSTTSWCTSRWLGYNNMEINSIFRILVCSFTGENESEEGERNIEPHQSRKRTELFKLLRAADKILKNMYIT